ncbi:MAG: exodeoxyribonuclease VII small subunit [Alcaligenaceae bacterium]|nr:exodeoxyribonuclease VII small subunit [Alcaligenaceae bacterium]
MATKQSAPADDRRPPASEPLPEDFEAALVELEALVERMEGGDLGLDESITAYERGAALAQVCRQRLDAAEQQVAVLQENLLRSLAEPEDDSSS